MPKIFFILLLALFSFQALSSQCELIEKTVNYLASDDLNGRVPGTSGNLKARRFLIKELSNLGLKVHTHKFSKGVNIYTTLYPKGSRKKDSPRVLLSAHYDGLKHCDRKLGANSNICNGASDDAAALAALLASIRHLKNTISHPILIIFFDAEESGLIGSRALVADYKLSRLDLDLKKLKLMINLDIIGLNLFNGLESITLAMGGETGGKKLLKDITKASKVAGLDVYNLSYALTHNRADVSSFINAYLKIPIIHITSGDGSIYHSSADEVQYLNLDKVLKTSKLVASLTMKALDNKYKFSRPKMFGGTALPHFFDVDLALKLVKKTIEEKDRNGFSTFELNQLQNMDDGLSEVKKDGKNKFNHLNMRKFANITFKYTGFSRSMDTIPKGSSCR